MYFCFSVEGGSSVRTYLDCHWITTQILHRHSLSVPKNADLIIGYMFQVRKEEKPILWTWKSFFLNVVLILFKKHSCRKRQKPTVFRHGVGHIFTIQIKNRIYCCSIHKRTYVHASIWLCFYSYCYYMPHFFIFWRKQEAVRRSVMALVGSAQLLEKRLVHTELSWAELRNLGKILIIFH